MPRPVLLALVALVLAGHWLALAHLPLGVDGAPADAPTPVAFQTRMLPASAPAARAARPEAAQAPEAARPTAPPSPPAAEPARPRPKPAPRPAPAPAAAPPPDAAARSLQGAENTGSADSTPPPRHAADGDSADPAPALPAQASRAYADDVALATAADLLGEEAAPGLPGGPQDEAAPPFGAAPDAAPDPAPDAAPGPAALQPEAPQPPAPQPALAAAPPDAPAGTAATEAVGVDIRPPGAGAALLQGALPPVRLPAPARLAFQVQGQAKRLHYRASAELTWQHDGQRYQARQQIKAFLLGTRAQSSTGRITAHGLQPERFGDKSRSERAAHFDFAKGEVTFSANAPRASIHEGAQDRLSVFLQLGAMLAAAPERYPAGTQITLTTVGVKNADRWTFTVQGQEQLELPIGSVPALKLQRVPRADKDYDQTAELWLGTQLGYLPVRIRITQANGDFADLLLDEQSEP